ncbi:MAG: hypothetical protein GW886_00045, partial [Rhodobacterales bacterium]|nr:hypothetical protein [Rhodobacterales bacterium]
MSAPLPLIELVCCDLHRWRHAMTLQETMEAIGETLAEAVAIVDCGLRRDTPVVVWANALMQMHRAQGRSIEIGAALEATWEIADADALTAGLASGATFDLVLAP